MRILTITLTSIIAFATLASAKLTQVSIVDDMFYINGKPTYEGRYWNNHKIEGLLLNSRMVQGVFDDENEKTKELFKYPDTGVWDANRNTDEFVKAMEDWHKHGLLAFTLNLQGGSPIGYGNKGWINSAFDTKGNFKQAYKDRTKKIIDKADQLGMVVILGYFYFGQDEYLEDEKAVINAVDQATKWILDEGFTNVIIETANECDIHYDHDIIKAKRNHELIKRVKETTKDGRRLLVSTSFKGNTVPTNEIIAESDFILLHGNAVSKPEGIKTLVDKTRNMKAYTTKPVVINEDDHFNFEKEKSNFSTAIEEYVSWGLFDYRFKNEGYDDGYQSVPVNWGISSPRKKAFFKKLKEITGY